MPRTRQALSLLTAAVAKSLCTRRPFICVCSSMRFLLACLIRPYAVYRFYKLIQGSSLCWFQNFSLVYLRYGYPRLAPADQVRILPSLLLSLLSRTAQQDRYVLRVSWSSHVTLSLSPSVLQLCVPALVHLQWPQDIRQRRDLLPLSDQSDVGKILVEFLLLYLLLPYGCVLLLLYCFRAAFTID